MHGAKSVLAPQALTIHTKLLRRQKQDWPPLGASPTSANTMASGHFCQDKFQRGFIGNTSFSRIGFKVVLVFDGLILEGLDRHPSHLRRR